MKQFLSLTLLLMPLTFANATSNSVFLNEKVYSDSIRSENRKDISAQDLSAIKELLFSQYSADQDRQYFEKVTAGFKPYKITISASEKNKTVSIFGEGFDVTLSEINREKKSLKINSQDFQFKDGVSLETATAQISAILNKRPTQNSAGLIPLLMGAPAYAKDSNLLLALTGVLPEALNEVRVIALTDSLENLTRTCKKRIPGVAYEDSLAYSSLSKISRGKPVFSLDEQRQITDCKQWAESGTLKDYIESKKSLVKLCERGREAQKCMDEYKNSSKKPASPNSSKPGTTAQ